MDSLLRRLNLKFVFFIRRWWLHFLPCLLFTLNVWQVRSLHSNGLARPEADVLIRLYHSVVRADDTDFVSLGREYLTKLTAVISPLFKKTLWSLCSLSMLTIQRIRLWGPLVWAKSKTHGDSNTRKLGNLLDVFNLRMFRSISLRSSWQPSSVGGFRRTTKGVSGACWVSSSLQNWLCPPLV